MNFNELTLYTGIATVFAFAACATVRKNSFSRFYLFMTLFVIAMVTGTFAYYPFFALVPGMDKTNPTRLIFLFVFVFAAAAGLGIGGLEDATRTRRKIFIGVSSLITAAVVSFSFVAGRPGITRWINRELYAEIPQAELPAFVANVGDFRGLTSPAIYQPLLVCLAVFFLFLLFVLVRRKKIVNVVFFLIAALLSYDLISFGRNYNTTVPPKYIYPTTPAIEFLLKQKGPFRVLQDTGNGLYVNTLMPYGLEEVGGYMSVYPDRVNKLMSYIRFGNRIFAGEIFDRWVRFGSNTTDFSWPVFDLMNVRYVLTAPNVRMPYKKYKLVFQGDLAIYENMQVMPRAYVVHDCAVVSGLKNVLQYMWSDNFHVRDSVVLEKSPSAEFLEGIGPPKYPPEVSIVRYTPDKVIIAADLSTNGWLVLSDTYYPGWRAEVDGKEVEIQRANCNFRAVALRAGKHRVSFTYVPLSGRVGMILTFIGLTASLAGIVIFRKR